MSFTHGDMHLLHGVPYNSFSGRLYSKAKEKSVALKSQASKRLQ